MVLNGITGCCPVFFLITVFLLQIIRIQAKLVRYNFSDFNLENYMEEAWLVIQSGLTLSAEKVLRTR